MPYPPSKSENYTNLGGINNKVSQYLTHETEFLNIENLSFQTPGTLSSFPGTTQVVAGAGISGFITGIADFFINYHTGQIGSPSYCLGAADQANFYNLNALNFSSPGSVYSFLYPGNTNLLSMVRANKIFACNQFDFFEFPKVNGDLSDLFLSTPTTSSTYAIQYGLPKPIWLGTNYWTGTSNSSGFTGIFNMAAAYVREDGLVGPAAFISVTLPNGYTSLSFLTPTFPIMASLPLGFSNFSIQGMWIWFNDQGLDPILYNGSPGFYNPNTFGSTFTLRQHPAGVTAVTSTVIPQDGIGTFLYGFDQPTDLASSNASFSGASYGPVLAYGNYNPSTIEIYNNQLFAGGFLYDPDTVWYSNVGDFENHDPENFFEVSALDGDIITCLKSYFTQLIIFKVNSTSALAGDDPDNFILAQTTNQYGCLSVNGACVWEQKLWFLDKKGICEYNGANTQIVSTKVENYFQRMNVSAARTTASILHVKQRNEIWCLIPIDGSTTNNILIFYDYISNAWGTRTADNTCFSKEIVGYTLALPYAGGLSGNVFQFGNSLLTNNGTPFTCTARTRFIHDMGNSIEKQFRRLYLDATIPPGTTQNIGINFYTDQGNTPVLSMTMSMSQFQQRIDFGLPAKDLSVEFLYNGGQFFKLNGYTIEYRFQRNT